MLPSPFKTRLGACAGEFRPLAETSSRAQISKKSRKPGPGRAAWVHGTVLIVTPYSKKLAEARLHIHEARVTGRFPQLTLFLLGLFILPGVRSAYAVITLPKVLASHMVIQRDLPVHVWGWATAGEAVTVGFRGETRSSLIDRF